MFLYKYDTDVLLLNNGALFLCVKYEIIAPFWQNGKNIQNLSERDFMMKNFEIKIFYILDFC